MQPQDYKQELAAKQASIVEVFRAFPNLASISIPEVIADSAPDFYRNKAIYMLGLVKGQLLAGFYKNNTHELVDTTGSDIQDPALTEMANRLRKLIVKAKLSIYDETTGKGFLRAFFLRLGRQSAEMMVALITQGGLFEQGAGLAEKITQIAYGLQTRDGKPIKVASVMRNINEARGNVVLGEKSLPLKGRDYLMDRIGKLQLHISLNSFYQVNPTQAVACYRLAQSMAGIHGKGLVVDAYAGIGTIALWFASQARQVIGIEEVPTAIANAKENAKLNGFQNCEFHLGKVEQILPKLAQPIDLLILDPPRQGCSQQVLEQIVQLKPKRILYISCSAKSLARDLNFLAPLGVKVNQLRSIDFFPHTEHVEMVASLSLIKG